MWCNPLIRLTGVADEMAAAGVETGVDDEAVAVEGGLESDVAVGRGRLFLCWSIMADEVVLILRL